jgi:hypothetical protein
MDEGGRLVAKSVEKYKIDAVLREGGLSRRTADDRKLASGRPLTPGFARFLLDNKGDLLLRRNVLRRLDSGAKKNRKRPPQ